ncbi:glycosyltransferase family 4 protein [Clostridium sp. Marseille-P2415]|uniref:glycosyltransferase family 4 protein n=1 Tax=Clostridium sp. Marseille-P2415 TaxID=1805471 RepID=UPI001115A143|nr:glycosyltransferase family 1 protein [Clostridium sp. Marseille-P2415]
MKLKMWGVDMRVLIDLTSLADNFSGIERFALSITKELIVDNKRKDIKYILLFKNSIHEEFKSIEPNVKSIVLKGKNKLIFNQVILPSALMKIKADYYFFPAFPAPFFFFNKKAISTIHDVGCWDCPSKNKKYMTVYFKIMYWKAAYGNKQVVTVSEFSKERIQIILKKSPSQINVIYDGIADCFENFTYDIEKNKKAITEYKLPDEYLLCLSTLEPRKNLRLLVEAYDQLLTEGKVNIDLVLAGRKGWLVDDLLANLKKNTVDRIHFTGFVDDNLLPYVYRNARLFVFPSIYEGFGVPPIEAMSMGIPVVSSDAASLPEVLGNAAFFFPNRDCEGLKKEILNVLSLTENELSLIKKKGIKQAQKFSWKKEAEKLRNNIFI